MDKRITNPLDEVLRRDYEDWGDRPYLHHEGGILKDKTFGEFITDVNYVAKYLVDQGFSGSNIGIYSPNSIEWMTIDIAVMNYVGVSAGFSKEWNDKDVSYALKKCDIKALFYSRALGETVEAVRGDFSDVRFICIEDEWNEILSYGKEQLQGLFSLEPQDADSVVRIVYTSGTTSFPKAVMLTFTNIFSGWKSLGRRVSVDYEDVCYLFLPLNHTYGGIFNFIYSLVFGFKVYLATSIRDMAKEMMAIRPTIFCAVPIVVIRLQQGAARAGVSVATLMGGRMRYLFCGGAPLSEELRKTYEDAGLEILNAYALSETSSSLSIDYPGDTVKDSAGTVFEDIEVKVMEPDQEGYGEIAVRGDNVFAGYYGDEKATAEVFTEDGFFLTGDVGRVVDNHIYLRGRKDIRLVFANGEKISAGAVAERVSGLHDKIKSVKVYIRDNELTCDIYIAAVPDDALEKDFEKLIAGMNEEVSKYEKVQKYNLYNADRLLK